MRSNHWSDSALSTVGAAVDRTLLATIGARTRRAQGRPPTEDLAARLARLDAVHARYSDVPSESFFSVEPGAPTVRERPAGSFIDGAPMTDLQWTPRGSTVDPALESAIVNDVHNRDARARWIGARDSRRPVALMIHGYLGGDPEWEQKFMPVRDARRWGFDVALFTLPFHGARKEASRKGAPKFPSVDAAFNVEVFRRAVIELRELVAIARDRGAPSVGVFGMSLGGYTTALLTSAEPTLSFSAPMIPLASLADFTREHNRLPGSPDEQRAIFHALDRAMAPVSPLHRAPAIDPERITVLAARGDRITPHAHAERLAAHTGAELVTFAGGHLAQFGRRAALETLRERLAARGVL